MANAVDFVEVACDPAADVTLHDVLADKATPEEATYEAPGGFDILPSGTTLDGYAAAKPRRLISVVTGLSRSYDFVLIDVGAGLNRETLYPHTIADQSILVSIPRVASVRDTKKTVELTERVDGSVAGVVFIKSGTGSAPPSERIASFLGVDLLGHVLDDPAVHMSQDAGQPVVVHAPKCPAARAYVEIARRIIAPTLESPNVDGVPATDGGHEHRSKTRKKNQRIG